jgi:hypothetical protein
LFCQIDLCELLGSGEAPENGTISRYLPVFPECPGEPIDLREIMPLQLEIVSDHKDILGDDCAREFGESGGTIGRSLENDWILPDPNHFMSGKHATIDFQAGAYYLADISSNGVWRPVAHGRLRIRGDTG